MSAALARPPQECHPRRCECNFCSKQGAAYVSDPKGRLVLRIQDAELCHRYRQGSGLAEFISCARCGVLVGVFHQDAQRVFGSLNARMCAPLSPFGAEQALGSQHLRESEKLARWKEIWFPDVKWIAGQEELSRAQSGPDAYYWR